MEDNLLIAQTPEQQQIFDDCITQCMDSARLSEKCARMCCMFDNMALNDCTKLCRDCAEICFLHARFMLRETPFLLRTCELCAEICNACATECDKAVSIVQGSGMERDLLLACAQTCRHCVACCNAMVKRSLQ